MLRELTAMDDLTIPLGQNRKARPPRAWVDLLLRVAVIVLCLPPALFAGWVLFSEDRSGGEPIGVSQIRLRTETAGTKTQTPMPKTIPASSSIVAQQPLVP